MAEVLDKNIGINQTSATLHLHANITEACWVFLQLCVMRAHSGLD